MSGGAGGMMGIGVNMGSDWSNMNKGTVKGG